MVLDGNELNHLRCLLLDKFSSLVILSETTLSVFFFSSCFHLTLLGV